MSAATLYDEPWFLDLGKLTDGRGFTAHVAAQDWQQAKRRPVLPRSAVDLVTASLPQRVRQRVVAALVAVKLWVETPDGYELRPRPEQAALDAALRLQALKDAERKAKQNARQHKHRDKLRAAAQLPAGSSGGEVERDATATPQTGAAEGVTPPATEPTVTPAVTRDSPPGEEENEEKEKRISSFSLPSLENFFLPEGKKEEEKAQASRACEDEAAAVLPAAPALPASRTREDEAASSEEPSTPPVDEPAPAGLAPRPAPVGSGRPGAAAPAARVPPRPALVGSVRPGAAAPPAPPAPPAAPAGQSLRPVAGVGVAQGPAGGGGATGRPGPSGLGAEKAPQGLDEVQALVVQVVALWCARLQRDPAEVDESDRRAVAWRVREHGASWLDFRAALEHVATDTRWFGQQPSRQRLRTVCGKPWQECVDKGRRKLAAAEAARCGGFFAPRPEGPGRPVAPPPPAGPVAPAPRPGPGATPTTGRGREETPAGGPLRLPRDAFGVGRPKQGERDGWLYRRDSYGYQRIRPLDDKKGTE